ncbi:type II toxin-antitoxin system RelE/ParE family toxin [Geomonas oryzae]|uniref:type II toxin-antitoxin system RelE/ParE family toxin n=1 Tax=Geomonas oryzae TaxID=2364273 RepID=UPI00100B36DD|nr:type II toxin-antitoxin system YafQ family toxin [Geomonas oryzae]
MRPKAINYDASFEKQWLKYLRKLSVREKEQLKERLSIFKEDAFDKRLKTHRLKGNLKEYHAFSISYSDRIVFRLLDDEEVLFIQIGSHDICY